MELVRVAGIDPSLRNTGIAVADVCPEGNIVYNMVRIHLLRTEPAKNKTQRKSSADFEAAAVIADGLRQHTKDCSFVFAEIPSGTQSARASFTLGIVLGLMASINPPPLEVTPTQTKVGSVGIRTATKSEMIEWATDKYPELDWHMRGDRYLNSNEHMADAIGVIHAGLSLPSWGFVRAALKRM